MINNTFIDDEPFGREGLFSTLCKYHFSKKRKNFKTPYLTLIGKIPMKWISFFLITKCQFKMELNLSKP